jgi:glucose/arabinose dehydrogenase
LTPGGERVWGREEAIVAGLRLALVLLLGVAAGQGLLQSDDEPPAQAAFTVPVALPGGDLPGDPAVQLVEVVDGLIDPVNVASANDGSGRLFVLERVGRIRIVQDGELVQRPFLDVSAKVEYGHLEQGLLGLAFDPDYPANGSFYVTYTDYQRNGALRLVRYTVSADDPNRADPESDRLILSQDKPFRYHNGGELHFGADGYLYLAIGDGGFAHDPYEAVPPALDTLLGKIIRIDVHPADEEALYAIPPDNPFAVADPAAPEARPEIWVHGLRNPWQFAFDRQTGDLYVADVGPGRVEEIDVQPAGSPGGENYGWNKLEGTYCWPSYRESCEAVGVPPVAQYLHEPDNCAIVGIGVYRGLASPALDGLFFNGDFCSGRLWGLGRDGDGRWVYQELLDTSLLVTGGGEDERGELYLTSCTCTFSRRYDPYDNPTGGLWRLVAAETVAADEETAPLDPPVEQSGTPVAAVAAAAATYTNGARRWPSSTRRPRRRRASWPSSRSRAAAATSTSTTRRWVVSGSIGCSTPRSTTRPTTASSRTPWPRTATTSTSWSWCRSRPSPAA